LVFYRKQDKEWREIRFSFDFFNKNLLTAVLKKTGPMRGRDAILTPYHRRAGIYPAEVAGTGTCTWHACLSCIAIRSTMISGMVPVQISICSSAMEMNSIRIFFWGVEGGIMRYHRRGIQKP